MNTHEYVPKKKNAVGRKGLIIHNKIKWRIKVKRIAAIYIKKKRMREVIKGGGSTTTADHRGPLLQMRFTLVTVDQNVLRLNAIGDEVTREGKQQNGQTHRINTCSYHGYVEYYLGKREEREKERRGTTITVDHREPLLQRRFKIVTVDQKVLRLKAIG